MANRTERITPNGHKVVLFNPRRYAKRTLFNRVVKELKQREHKPINWFKIVLIELKEKQTQMLYKGYSNKLPYPIYRGDMYGYKYVLPTNRKVNYYFDRYDRPEKKTYIICESELFNYINHPIIKYGISKTIKDIYNWDGSDMSEKTLKDIKDILKTKKQYTNQYYRDILYNNLYKEEYNPKYVRCDIRPYLIRVRYVIGNMKYTTNNYSYRSVLNLKRWDKNTKKTSNKGLKADTTYSWSDDYHRGGWVFGGLKVDDLEHICIENGFIKEKGKKYQYGDFAEWYIKI